MPIFGLEDTSELAQRARRRVPGSVGGLVHGAMSDAGSHGHRALACGRQVADPARHAVEIGVEVGHAEHDVNLLTEGQGELTASTTLGRQPIDSASAMVPRYYPHMSMNDIVREAVRLHLEQTREPTAQFARRADVKRPTLIHWLKNDTVKLGIDKLQGVCRALGLELDVGGSAQQENGHGECSTTSPVLQPVGMQQLLDAHAVLKVLQEIRDTQREILDALRQGGGGR